MIAEAFNEKVDLSKVEIGTPVKLRNGDIKKLDGSDEDIFFIDMRKYNKVGKSFVNSNDYDIVEILPKEDKMVFETGKVEDGAKYKVEETLQERGEEYGEFSRHAEISQKLKNTVKLWLPAEIEPYKMEALEMILHKIARICNGNSNNIDSWHDIAGYATLVVKELEK